jgi:hypothetical protein
MLCSTEVRAFQSVYRAVNSFQEWKCSSAKTPAHLRGKGEKARTTRVVAGVPDYRFRHHLSIRPFVVVNAIDCIFRDLIFPIAGSAIAEVESD